MPGLFSSASGEHAPRSGKIGRERFASGREAGLGDRPGVLSVQQANGKQQESEALVVHPCVLSLPAREFWHN